MCIRDRQYAASVMVLNPKHNQDVGAYGGRGAAPIWHDAFLPILSAQAAVPFPPAGLPLQDPHPPPPPRPRPSPVADEPPPVADEPPPAADEPPPDTPVDVPVEDVPVDVPAEDVPVDVPADPIPDPNSPIGD